MKPRTAVKAGWREVGGQRFYARSGWEANFACYLEWLRTRGEIQLWAHEPHTFWFEGVKRGTCSYLPDFLVVEKNGARRFYEVKGYMDPRSATKIKRMRKYHPTVDLVVIDAKAYRSLARRLAGLVPGWEGKR